MHVEADDEALLASLTAWLETHGWPLVSVDGTEADVLVPWDEDEFAAALRLRCDVAAWQAVEGAGRVTVDRDVWRVSAR
jgi:hypothetical protein